MIGGVPAGPEAVSGTLATVAAALDSLYNRTADWADNRSLAPASAAGIALIFGICAAAWFTAGTRTGNLYGALALAAGYLVALGSREFLSPAHSLVADLNATGAAQGGASAGLVVGTLAARSTWLAMLGTRLSEYAVYVGLAVGAAAEGWHGVWPLTIAVLGLASVCDIMTECSGPAWRPAARPDQSARARLGADAIEPDDTIPDVPAWGGTAPDAVPPDESRLVSSATPAPRHDDLPRDDGPLPGRAGPGGAGPGGFAASGGAGPDRFAASGGADGPAGPEQDHSGLGSLASRALLTALGMPAGGRVLLIAVIAPMFGAQPTLVALLDWGIIAVGYGIGSRTAGRRRDRRTDDRAPGHLDAAGAPAEPGGLAVLLMPARTAETVGSPPEPLADPQIPVVRITRSRSATMPEPVGTMPEPAGTLGAGAAHATLSDLAEPDHAEPDLAGPGRAAPDLRAPDLSAPDDGAPGRAAPGRRASAGDPKFDRAALASELSAAASFGSAAFTGDPSIGAAFGLAHADDAGPAQHLADPARAVPDRPGRGRFGDAGSYGGPGLGRLFSGRGGPSGRRSRAGGPDDDAVYDWADDGWPDSAADEGLAEGAGERPAEGGGASGGAGGGASSGAGGGASSGAGGGASSGASSGTGRGVGGGLADGPVADGPRTSAHGPHEPDARAATDVELADQDEWDAELAAEPQLRDYAQPGAAVELAEFPTLAERLGLGRPAPDRVNHPGPGSEPADPSGYNTAGDNGSGSSGSADPSGYDASGYNAADPSRYNHSGYNGYDASGYNAADPSGYDASGYNDSDHEPGSDYASLAAGPAVALAAGPGRAAQPGSAAGLPGPGEPVSTGAVLRNRDDGTLARWFGQLVRGQLMPLPAALLALAAVAMLAHLGLRDLPGILILAPALVMLVAAPGASHRHDGRFDWLVPAVLQGAQYVYIAALGFAVGVPAPITFLLCAAVALHYADLGSVGSPILVAVRRAGSAQVPSRRRRPAARRAAARSGQPRRSFQERLGQQRLAQQRRGEARPGQQPQGQHPAGQGPAGREPSAAQAAQRSPATELGMWMGWEGRMIAVGLGAAMGVAMFAYLALAGYLSWLICCKVRASYLGLREGDVR